MESKIRRNEDNKDDQLMVSIQCCTYNQEAYIRQCLEGIVMQKTDFRFEAIVHDDASTDGTVDIIREYEERFPDIIKPIYETENQYSKRDGSLERIMEEHTVGKYVAFCEGDDYWTDPLKLQKQVDILERNPEVGLVHSDCNLYYQITGKMIGNANSKIDPNGLYYSLSNSKDIINAILDRKYFVRTATVVLRKDLHAKIHENDPMLFDGHFAMGDIQEWIGVLILSKVCYLQESLATYRVVDNSSTHQKNYVKNLFFFLSSLELRLYYIEKYNFLEGKRESIKEQYKSILTRYRHYNHDYRGILRYHEHETPCKKVLLSCTELIHRILFNLRKRK